jgi:hypothetical protein
MEMTYRIRPNDLTPRGSSPFMTPQSARVGVPLADALASRELFMTVRSNLRAGDQVLICHYEGGDWNKARILEYVEVMITQSTPLAVEFDLMYPVRNVAAAKAELERPKKVDEPDELEIVPNEQGGFLVRKVADGHVERHFKTEPAAKRYITDYGKQKAA